MKIVYKKQKPGRAYQCKKCDIVFYWNEKSRWYGSYSDLENNPSKIIYYCSDECYEKDNKH